MLYQYFQALKGMYKAREVLRLGIVRSGTVGETRPEKRLPRYADADADVVRGGECVKRVVRVIQTLHVNVGVLVG